MYVPETQTVGMNPGGPAGHVLTWNGTGWAPQAPAGAVVYQAEPPANPTVGMLWVDSDGVV